MVWHEWKWWRLAWSDNRTAQQAVDNDGHWTRVVSGLYWLSRRRLPV
jgi:hypothetical protein